MTKKYQIQPLVWLVKDEKSVRFHVKNDDYFGTMATVLDILKQRTDNKEKKIIKTLEQMTKDFLFLQKHFQIEKKLKPSPKTKSRNAD